MFKLRLFVFALMLSSSITLHYQALAGVETGAKGHKKDGGKIAASQVKQVSADKHAGDSQAINNLLSNMVQALEHGKADDLANCWSPDGTYINELGTTLTGRDAIKADFVAFFKNSGTLKVTMKPQALKFLDDRVALQDGTSQCKPLAGGHETTANYSIVFIKESGAWKIESLREMAAQVIVPPPVMPKISSLDWLVGSWSGSGAKGTVKMNCQWASNKSFLLCQYDIEPTGEPAQYSTQIIGIDPATNQIHSWHFGSTGGVGQDTWQGFKNGWAIRAAGTRFDGLTTSAVNIVKTINNNSFSWQSVNRQINGISIPDTLPITMNRVAN
jgi:uncharacterized protein (TIGR02246 family)